MFSASFASSCIFGGGIFFTVHRPEAVPWHGRSTKPSKLPGMRPHDKCGCEVPDRSRSMPTRRGRTAPRSQLKTSLFSHCRTRIHREASYQSTWVRKLIRTAAGRLTGSHRRRAADRLVPAWPRACHGAAAGGIRGAIHSWRRASHASAPAPRDECAQPTEIVHGNAGASGARLLIERGIGHLAGRAEIVSATRTSHTADDGCKLGADTIQTSHIRRTRSRAAILPNKK